MRTTSNPSTQAKDDAVGGDRPSNPRVDQFLAGIEEGRSTARRTRFLGLGVGALIAAVALLTAIGLIPVGAESVVLTASAVVAALTLGKSS